MKIKKVKDEITITRNGQTLSFEGLPPINRKRNTIQTDLSRDDLLFLELERHWTTLTPKELDELWEAYEMVQDLTAVEPSVLEQHLPKVISVIDRLHKPESFKKLYPMNKVWIPEKLQENFDGLPPNYPEAMTYIRPEYYELMIETLVIKPYLPVFNLLGAYIGGKGLSQDTKRKVVLSMVRCFSVISETAVARSPAIEKLRVFLGCLVDKFQKETNKGMGGTSLSVLASVRGYGSDMLEEYLLAYTVVFVLGLHPVGADYNTAALNDNNTISQIFYAIRSEVDGGFASKISGQSVILKQHPSNTVFNGEKGKTNAIDLVQARSPAPVKESVRTGVAVTDYRRFIKMLKIDATPAAVKTLIDSIVLNHTGPIYELHEWLVAAAIHSKAHRQTYKDISSDEFKYAMGIAQAVYLNYGMHEVAQLLSCQMIPGNVSGHPIHPIEPDIKIKMDRYYPHDYRTTKGGSSNESAPRESLRILLDQHIAPYHFNLACTEEAKVLIKSDSTSVVNMRLGGRIQTQLAEFLTIQARRKMDEVEFFNS
jgi:hypothetical protein